jgi:hypothetical protein
MIYLSWSPAQLAMHFAVLAAAYSFFMWRYKEKRSVISKLFACLAIATAYIAFDVGARQQDLQRSSFNQVQPDVAGKVLRETMDRSDAKQSINQALEASK